MTKTMILVAALCGVLAMGLAHVKDCPCDLCVGKGDYSKRRDR